MERCSTGIIETKLLEIEAAATHPRGVTVGEKTVQRLTRGKGKP